MLSEIRAHQVIGCPMIVLAGMLLSEPPGWLSTFLRIACVEADESVLRAQGITETRAGRPKSARIQVGEPGPGDAPDSVAIPISWQVAGYRVVPHRFEGVLALEPVDGTGTNIRLEGTWQAGNGVRLDFAARSVARAAAEASLERLLANLRAAVEEAARTSA